MEDGNGPNLECRMYEPKLPEVETMVMVMVKNITELGAYVVLLEYNNIEGMILLSELSKRRIRSVKSLIKVGRIEPVMVIRVEKEKGYIDLSKRRVSEEDIARCEERYNKSKLVHSIMRHVAESTNVDLEVLYELIAWPLHRKHGHAFDAFKTVVTDPDSVLAGLNAVTVEMKDALVKNVRRRMTPQPLKIRADIEMKCFEFDGVLHIKEAMRKAEAAGTDDCPVKIKLVAAPLYVITIQTLDKDQGFSTVNKAITACSEEIRRSKGMLVVKEAARIVSESDDKLFRDGMEKINRGSEEEDGDDDDDDSDEDEEDTGMGDIDVDNGVIQY